MSYFNGLLKELPTEDVFAEMLMMTLTEGTGMASGLAAGRAGTRLVAGLSGKLAGTG